MPPEQPVRISDLLTQINNLSTTHNIPVSTFKFLLSGLTGFSIPELTMHKNFALSRAVLSLWENGVARLLQGEPVQYILGWTEFYGLKLAVNEDVLIPRPETEGLVQWIISRERKPLRILDIGTGNGAIALALKHERPDFRLTATDISPGAVKLARANARRLALDVTFVIADLFPAEPKRFDLIVSNPPYVSPREYKTLGTEVRWFEPRLALKAYDHGLEFYRRILKQVKNHLYPGGIVYLEIGETQQDGIFSLAKQYGLEKVESKLDLAGRDRYLCMKL